jgi:hypothetical protein
LFSDLIQTMPSAIRTRELQIDRHLIIARPKRRQRSVSLQTEFRRFLPLVPLSAFTIDGGVPIPRRSVLGIFRPSEAVSKDRVERIRRPAALAGWAVVPVTRALNFEDLSRQVTSWAKNHPYERV